MSVGDLILVGRSFFKVRGVYLGGVGTQNLVGLKSMSLRPGAAQGSVVREMFVPEELVKHFPIYRPVQELKTRPTIEELERILNSDDDRDVLVMPDGSISVD